MNEKRKHLTLIVSIFLVLFLIPVSLYSKSIKDGPHGDKKKLKNGCGSCHKGHGKYNTPMLPETKDVFCFRCHGHMKNIEETRKKGDLAENTKAADIQKEFENPITILSRRRGFINTARPCLRPTHPYQGIPSAGIATIIIMSLLKIKWLASEE